MRIRGKLYVLDCSARLAGDTADFIAGQALSSEKAGSSRFNFDVCLLRLETGNKEIATVETAIICSLIFETRIPR